MNRAIGSLLMLALFFSFIFTIFTPAPVEGLNPSNFDGNLLGKNLPTYGNSPESMLGSMSFASFYARYISCRVMVRRDGRGGTEDRKFTNSKYLGKKAGNYKKTCAKSPGIDDKVFIPLRFCHNEKKENDSDPA